MKSSNLSIFSNDLSQEALDHYLHKNIVACDTETRGLMIPRDRLCLIQLCDDENNVSVVRFSSKDDFMGNKQPNLVKLLSDPKVTKLFHYARFDVAVLK